MWLLVGEEEHQEEITLNLPFLIQENIRALAITTN